MISDRAAERIGDVSKYINEMERERQGWGIAAMEDVYKTSKSFVEALGTLVEAEDVYIDGGAGYSFGGVMPGGIHFGMIARLRPAARPEFIYEPMEWTFHS